MTQHARTTALTVFTAMTAAAWVLGLGLLIGGTMSDHHVVMAWGVVTVGSGIGMASLIGLHVLIQHAVTSCAEQTAAALKREVDAAIATTAMQVGDAIAAALSEDDLAPERNGTARIYS